MRGENTKKQGLESAAENLQGEEIHLKNLDSALSTVSSQGRSVKPASLANSRGITQTMAFLCTEPPALCVSLCRVTAPIAAGSTRADPIPHRSPLRKALCEPPAQAAGPELGRAGGAAGSRCDLPAGPAWFTQGWQGGWPAVPGPPALGLTVARAQPPQGSPLVPPSSPCPLPGDGALSA